MADELAPGAAERQRLIDGGFTGTEADAWQQERSGQLFSGGFTPDEVNKYWGVRPTDRGPIAATLTGNLDGVGVDSHAKVATNWMELFTAGYQHSSAGLIQGKPNVMAPPDAGFLEKLMVSAGGLVGDTPAMVAGVTAGAVLAAPTGPGAVFAAGAGGAALPAAIREILTGYYNNPDGPKNWQDFLGETAQTQWEIVKAAISGGTGMSAGVAVGAKVAGAAAPLLGEAGATIVGGVANAAAFAGAATATDAALRGQVPSAEDFLAGAILAVGLSAAGEITGASKRFVPNARGKEVAENLQKIYARTGLTPQETVQMARGDVVLQGEILGPNRPDGTSATPTIDANRKTEPTQAYPYKPAITATNVEKTIEPPKAEEAPHPAYNPDVAAKMPAYLELFRKLEGSDWEAKRAGIPEAQVVSTAGAIGRYQIMPGTARQYGFDASKLTDPAYNEMVAKAIIADLHQRYKGDFAAMAIAYNAGPGRADIWLRSGRNMAMLPRETQKYLQHADELGALGGTVNWDALAAQYKAQGDPGNWVPPSDVPAPSTGNPFTMKGSAFVEDVRPPPKIETERMNLTDENTLRDIMLEKIAPATGQRPAYLDPRQIVATFEFQLTPARKLDESMGTGKNGEVGVEDMMRSTLASRERAGIFVRYGTLDPITLEQRSDASFIRAFEAVRKDGGTVEGFTAYRLAKRTVEKAAQGVDTGFPLDKAQAYIAKAGVRAKYERGNDIMREVKDASIDYAVDSGRFSIEFAEALKALNREHIVMRRVLEPGYNPPSPRKVFGWQRGLKIMKGSDKDIVDPLTADMDNLHTIIAISDFNRAIGNVIAMVEKTQAAQAKAKARGEQMEAFVPFEKMSGEMSARSEIREGELLDEHGNPITGKAKDAAELFLATRKAWGSVGPNEFVYYRDGKFEIWKAHDENLVRMMRMTWPGKINPFVDAAIRVAGMVRAGVTTALDFPARNIFQSQLGAAVLAEHSTFPFSDFMHGVMGVFKGSDKYREFERMGGAGTAITDIDVNYIKKDVGRLFNDTGTIDAVTNVMKHPIDAMRTLSHMLDAASRLGMFDRLTQQGVDPLKAAMLARKGNIDYGEGFANPGIQTYSRMVAFMSASWKDLQQITQSVASNPKRVAILGASILTMPTILNYMMNWMADQALPDGDKYQDLPRWMRDQYWVFPPIFGVRLKLKRPYTVAVPFALLPERMMDWLATNDPHFGEWVPAALTLALPPWLPNIALPIAEQYSNKSMVTGAPLVPASLEKASGYMQYKADTTETAKALTRLIGPAALNLADASPIVIDNYIREWGGTMPMAILKIFETPIKDPGRPKTLADMPFLGSFFVRNPVGGQRVDDFYEKYNNVVAAKEDLRLAIERNDITEIKDATKAEAVIKMSTITTALSNMRKAVSAINQSDMTDEEKIKRTDQLGVGMVETAKAGSLVLDTLARLP